MGLPRRPQYIVVWFVSGIYDRLSGLLAVILEDLAADPAALRITGMYF